MKVNVGKKDKLIRVVFGLIAIALGVFIHWGFYILGGALIVTAITGVCGIYALFGITTCPRKAISK